MTHLECARTGQHYDADALHNLSEVGAPLLARYDLEKATDALSREQLKDRPANMWRYREVMPISTLEEIVSLGEGFTPIHHTTRLGQWAGFSQLYIKDESLNPTGSFKARGLSAAVTAAKARGATKLAIPTAGNAGGALSAYAAACGLPAIVFMPRDTPSAFAIECKSYGAELELVDGLISDCGKIVGERKEKEGWFDVSTLKEPYRVEGKKTMGYELAEQFAWTLPDVVIYPTGGGTGLIGMWKAFAELREMGWLEGDLPRMVAVQTTGCAPIIKAFDAGLDEVPEPWENVDTEVHGVRVRKAFGDRLILSALYESGGFAIAVDDREVHDMRIACARADGFHLCPEGTACLAAYAHAINDGRIAKSDRAVIFNSANGLKSPIPVN